MQESRERHQASSEWQRYLEIARRRRRWLVVPFFIGWAALWLSGWILPAQYRSEAVVLVERPTVPKDYVVPNVNMNVQERLQSMTQQILSRNRLQQIIDEKHLYADKKSRMSPDELIDLMRSDIEVSPVSLPNQQTRNQTEITAFKIAYLAPNPGLAQQVTAQLSSLFVDENLRQQQQRSESTTDFLQSQLEDARRQLDEQEQKIQDFKSRYLGELPDQEGVNAQLVSSLQSRLQSAQEAINRAEQQRTYLTSLSTQYKAMRPTSQAATSGADVDKLKAQLAELSTRYTDQHPDIVRLKSEIAQAERQESKPAPDASETPKASNYAELQAMSPIMQIDSQLKANTQEIDSRRREVKTLEQQISAYSGRMYMAPLRQQQLLQLTRDYEQTRKNYDDLLAKKNDSELATNLEMRQQGQRFRLLDAASLPEKPAWPDRMKLTLLGLVVGLAMAAGGAAVREFSDDRVHSRADLESVVSVTVLATIPPLPTSAEEETSRRLRLAEICTALAVLGVVVLGTVLAIYRG